MVTLAITSLGVEPDLGVLRADDATPSPVLIDGFLSGLQRMFFVAAGVVLAAALFSVWRGPPAVRRREDARPGAVGARTRDDT